MKKAIVGLAAIAAIIGLLRVVKRKAHKLREHCEQMAGKCKQMMAQAGGGDEAIGVREPPEPTDTEVAGRSEALNTA
jgi:hypothetical protein